MEHNVFRDYCKAENTEDEEDNCDLQSRLYAEIYYGSNNVENVDTKANIKLETDNVDSEEFHNNVNTNEAPDSNDSSAKSNFGESRTITNVTNDSMDNSMLTQNDDKSNIKTTSASNDIEVSYTDNKNNLSISCIRVLNQHTQENIEFVRDNQQSGTSHKVESNESNSDVHVVHDTNPPVLVKPETEVESKEELRSVQCLNFENDTTIIQSHVDSGKYNTDNNVKKIQEEECIKPKVDNSCDIFKKYEFSKLFINKLYLEKYENLEKRLQELEEEKQKCLRDKEQEKMEDEKRKEDEENQQEQSGTHVYSMEQMEKDTRYSVLATSEKAQKVNNDTEEVTLLSSDTESDSEESILEVPIPPKPQPPVINLQDSDDGSDFSNSDSDVNQDCLVVTENKNNSPKKNKRKTEEDSHGTSTKKSITDALIHRMTEDIILNCTQVQKGASSVKEIIEMSKNVQNTSGQCSDKDKNFCEKNKSVSINEVCNKNLSKTDKSLLSVNDKGSKFEFQVPLESISNSNIVYERDKNKSVSFASDVIVTDSQNSNKSSLSRKRHHEDDNEPCTSAKHKKNSDDENKHGKTNPEQCKDKDKKKQESWEEYFFRPMSDNLKAFYNESRGQENFDVQDIQSKMSKDPRLWAILDEDLMPNCSRQQRFWNMTCNNCHQKGHPAHSCPQPHKPPRCHICGIEGHTETRCPQKMCLTCGKKQGTFRKTCESCRTLYCEMCKAIGHKSTECPDHWRRFHQTTQNSEISIPDNLSEVMKPADSLYCCNCTKRGHDSSTCHEYRWSQHFPTPAFVSNYTDEPECEDPRNININDRDMIPLSKKTVKKASKTRYLTFAQGKGDLKSCHVLYTYGSFQSRNANGEEILRIAPGGIVPTIVTFLQGRNSTSILDKISKLVKFEVKLFRNPEKVIMIRVRTVLYMSEHIYEIFLYWLQLRDEERRHLSIDISLPRGLKNLLQLLTKKWQELEMSVQDHPKHLHKEIQFLKASMANINDPNTLSSISKKISEFQGKLLKMFHMQPKISKLARRLQDVINRLIKTAKKVKTDIPNIKYELFIHIVVIYNKLFLPRALTDSELRSLFDSYIREKNNENNKGKENKGSKKQKGKSNPYEKFLKNLHDYNSKADAQRKEKCTSMSNNTIQSPKVVATQGEEMPIVTPTTACSSSYIHQDNESAPNLFAEDISLDCYNTQNGFSNFNNVYPIEVVQLPRNQQDVPIIDPVENQIKVDRQITLNNLISIPLRKSVCPNTSSQHLQNDHLSSMPCTEIRSEGIREEQTEIINNSSGIVKSSTSQANDITCGAKKKKPKKEKKKQNPQDNTRVSENQVRNVDISLESKAMKVITEALAFNLPYVTKVVQEVQKRVTDKNIKQEHIDMLQRLINLEKDHQQYVSSFCSYLK